MGCVGEGLRGTVYAHAALSVVTVYCVLLRVKTVLTIYRDLWKCSLPSRELGCNISTYIAEVKRKLVLYQT